MKKKKRLEDRIGNTPSIISLEAQFTGSITGDDSLRIVGRYEGEIDVGGLVWIEETGKVGGRVTAPYVIIEGEVDGDIVAARHVEIRGKGRIRGDISSDIIAMEQGCVVEGEMRMSKRAEAAPETFSEKRNLIPVGGDGE